MGIVSAFPKMGVRTFQEWNGTIRVKDYSCSECVRGNRSRAGLDEEGGRARRRRRGHSSPLTLGSSRAGGNSPPTYTGHQESTSLPAITQGPKKTLNVKTTKRPPKDVKGSIDQRKNLESAEYFTYCLCAVQHLTHQQQISDRETNFQKESAPPVS